MRTIAKTLPLTPPASPSLLTHPSRCRWTLENLPARDGHLLTVTFTCSLAQVDQPSEKKLFEEVFPSAPALTHDQLLNHFLPALRSAATDLTTPETSQALLSTETRPRWIKTLHQAASETAFMCGLEVLAPFDAQVTSPTLQQERLEQMQRSAAERRSTDRLTHLARAADLLKQWEKLQADVPSITPGKLLQQLNPSDRGTMLDTLLMAGGQTQTTPPNLWAVSGAHLIQLDLKSNSFQNDTQLQSQPQLFPLPTTAGPLRSIRASSGKLLIGARSGVIIADPTKPTSAATVYHHPTLTGEHGFTSVTLVDNQIWACHRQGGLVGWQLDKPQAPLAVFSPAQLGGEPKNLISPTLYSVGAKLFRLPQTPIELQPDSPSISPIVALLPLPNQILVVSQNGSIITLDPQSLQPLAICHTPGPVSSAALLPWLGSFRLLLNLTDGPINCVGLEDQLVTSFTAAHPGPKAAAASPAHVAAMSSDRQRLLLWNAWDGRKPLAEIPLATLTRHRIADLTFAEPPNQA
jgi:hypothetical protein